MAVTSGSRLYCVPIETMVRTTSLRTSRSLSDSRGAIIGIASVPAPRNARTALIRSFGSELFRSCAHSAAIDARIVTGINRQRRIVMSLKRNDALAYKFDGDPVRNHPGFVTEIEQLLSSQGDNFPGIDRMVVHIHAHELFG